MAGRVGAFFDMDKTILAGSSAEIYMRDAWKKGRFGVLDFVRGLTSTLQFRLGWLDVSTWTESMLFGLAGREESTMVEEGQELFDRYMAKRIYPEAARLVADHLAEGHVVAIVSGSIPYVVEPLAASLGVDHVLCTQLLAEGGVLTGRCVEPVCLEEGKTFWLESFIEEHDVDLTESYFYSDSISDLPALELVGKPIATNPDAKLERTALRRGWQVRCFEDPLRTPEVG